MDFIIGLETWAFVARPTKGGSTRNSLGRLLKLAAHHWELEGLACSTFISHLTDPRPSRLENFLPWLIRARRERQTPTDYLIWQEISQCRLILLTRALVNYWLDAMTMQNRTMNLGRGEDTRAMCPSRCWDHRQRNSQFVFERLFGWEIMSLPFFVLFVHVTILYVCLSLPILCLLCLWHMHFVLSPCFFRPSSVCSRSDKLEGVMHNKMFCNECLRMHELEEVPVCPVCWQKFYTV